MKRMDKNSMDSLLNKLKTKKTVEREEESSGLTTIAVGSSKPKKHRDTSEIIKRIRESITPEELARIDAEREAEKEAIRRREEQRRYEEFQRTIKENKLNSGIPLRYRDAQLKPINQEQTYIAKKIAGELRGKKIEEIKSIILLGRVGTGKTYLACGLLNQLLDQGFSVRYETEHSLLTTQLEGDYKKLKEIRTSSLVVIDEVGKHETQDWQKKFFEETISYRYDNLLPTIIISNLNVADLKEYIGTRLQDRLRETATLFVFKGESLRGRGA